MTIENVRYLNMYGKMFALRAPSIEKIIGHDRMQENRIILASGEPARFWDCLCSSENSFERTKNNERIVEFGICSFTRTTSLPFCGTKEKEHISLQKNFPPFLKKCGALTHKTLPELIQILMD